MSDLSSLSMASAEGKSVTPPLSGKQNFGRDSHPFEPVRVPRQRRRGFVYFITDGPTIKIGHSLWPLSRFKSIRSPSGEPMQMLAWFPGYMDEEHSVHRFFADLLVGGAEWFANDQRIHDLIAKLERQREHLYAKRVTITDILLGLPGKVTPPDKVPSSANAFHGWSEQNAGELPSDMQVKAYAAWRGLEVGDRAPFNDFMRDYRKWANQ